MQGKWSVKSLHQNGLSKKPSFVAKSQQNISEIRDESTDFFPQPMQ